MHTTKLMVHTKQANHTWLPYFFGEVLNTICTSVHKGKLKHSSCCGMLGKVVVRMHLTRSSDFTTTAQLSHVTIWLRCSY